MVSDIDRRKGLSATAAAEVFWGLTPIYWKAVATVSTHELLALRVLWAIPFAVVLLTLRDAWGDVVARRHLVAHPVGATAHRRVDRL